MPNFISPMMVLIALMWSTSVSGMRQPQDPTKGRMVFEAATVKPSQSNDAKPGGRISSRRPVYRDEQHAPDAHHR